MEVTKNQKNNWSKSKVEQAKIKINNEIYKRNKQAPIQLKLDDLAIYINERITKRGIAKGMVFVQEDLNKNILDIQKKTIKILTDTNLKLQYEILILIRQIIKIEIWSDIRFLMVNKAITPGEITELIRRTNEIDTDIEKWSNSILIAISAER